MSNNIEKYDGEKDLNDTEVTVLPESEFVSDAPGDIVLC
jgi:hypothetical protein